MNIKTFKIIFGFLLIISALIISQKADSAGSCMGPWPENTILFYEDYNFGGGCVGLQRGTYNLTDYPYTYNSAETWNDKISSISGIPNGYIVTLYENTNTSGVSISFSAETSYVGNSYNDWASSVVITGPSDRCPTGQTGTPPNCSNPSSSSKCRDFSGVCASGLRCVDGGGCCSKESDCSATPSTNTDTPSNSTESESSSIFGGLYNPLTGDSIDEIITRLSVWFYVFAIPILALFILYGGFLIVTSAGEEEKYSKGIKVIKWGVIGFIILLLSGGITALIQYIVS